MNTTKKSLIAALLVFTLAILSASALCFGQDEVGNIGVKDFEVSVTPSLDVNVYIVFNRESKETVIIDPGAKDKRIDDYIKSNNLAVKRILNTHGHYDHSNANRYYADLYKVKISGHTADTSFYNRQGGNNAPDLYLKTGDRLAVKGLDINVLHTPGHSPGSVCYYINGILFSGDTLFRESIGRTWGDTEKEAEKKSQQEILNIKNKLLTLPGETKVYPGHGGATTIEHEKKNNSFLN